jgi:hypothetical protein
MAVSNSSPSSPGDLEERAISLTVPGEALFDDHHALEIPLPFANQERADFQSEAIPRGRPTAQSASTDLGLQAAKFRFPNARTDGFPDSVQVRPIEQTAWPVIRLSLGGSSQPKRRALIGPRDLEGPSGACPKHARQSTVDCRFNQRRGKERERQSHTDRPLGLALACGEGFDRLVRRRQLVVRAMSVAKRIDKGWPSSCPRRRTRPTRDRRCSQRSNCLGA